VVEFPTLSFTITFKSLAPSATIPSLKLCVIFWFYYRVQIKSIYIYNHHNSYTRSIITLWSTGVFLRTYPFIFYRISNSNWWELPYLRIKYTSERVLAVKNIAFNGGSIITFPPFINISYEHFLFLSPVYLSSSIVMVK
jgi:hypothetical protein